MNRCADCLRWGGRQSIPNQTGQHMSILGRSGNTAGECYATIAPEPLGSSFIHSWNIRHHLTVKSAGYCVADRRNSEFWQKIGQPYVRKSGRCFVAVVDIEADGLTSCFNRGGRSPTKGNSGKTVRWRRAGNKQSPDIFSLPICVSRFAANMDVSH